MYKKPFVSLDYISKIVGVSTRTIRNDIKKLNEELKKIASLECEQGIYRLYIMDKQQFEDKLKQMDVLDNSFSYPEKRMSYTIQILMRSKQPYLIDELALLMNIGRTTLIGDLKKLKEKIKPYKLDIIGKPNNGIMLIGEEINLRFFILENMYKMIYYNYPIDEKLINVVKVSMDKYYFETGTEFEFLKAITIMMDRLKSGNSVQYLDEKYYSLIQSPAFEIASVVCDKIEEELKICIPKEEKIFISLPISGMRTPVNTQFLSQVDKNYYILLVEKIMQTIKEELNLMVLYDNFLDEFTYHISFMINRLIFGFKIKNTIYHELREKYPLAYKIAKVAARVIEKEYNFIVTEDEVGYLTTYFGVFISEKNIQYQKEFKVAIVCGSGKGSARLIEAQLKKIFGKTASMDLFADNKVFSYELKKYSIIFSTVDLNLNIDVPVIIINEIFDEKEVLSQIETLKYLKKININLGKESISIIHALLDEDKFFVLDSNKTYMENLKFMIDTLTHKGYLDTEFANRIENSQKKRSMVFDKFIALPHTINMVNENIICALGVFPTTIIEGEKEIKLIFLLGIPENQQNDTLLVKIYDEIIVIAQRDEIIEEISQINDYNTLIKYFIKINSLFI